MKQESVNILNSQELIDAREYHMRRLEHIFAGEKPDKPFILQGAGPSTTADPYTEPEKWVDEAVDSLASKAEALLDKDVFRPLALECWLYGVHFTDRLFGAYVHCDETGQWWSPGVENDVGELPVPDLEHNETWKQAQRLTLAMVAAGVRVPFITTQVLGEPWNQTFGLYRDRGLMGFYDNPEGMKRDLGIVTDTLVEMHKWFRANIPEEVFQPILPSGRCQPRGYGQMCGCSTHMISHDIYEEFVREQDERILSIYPNGGMYHLCGHHAQHSDSWSDMPRVRAFQTNDLASDLFGDMFAKARPDQVFYVYTTPTMTREKILEITGGRQCVIIPYR